MEPSMAMPPMVMSPPMAMDPPMAMSPHMGTDMPMVMNEMMAMSFQWSRYVTLLFSKWKTSSTLEYISSLAAILLLAVFYQMLSSFRSGLVVRSKGKQVESGAVAADLALEAGSTMAATRRGSPKHPYHVKLLLTLLFGVNVAIGYLIMLCVMSFNVGVYLAVVFGLTIGYFFSEI